MFKKIGFIAVMLSACLFLSAGCGGAPGDPDIQYDAKDKAIGGEGTPDEDDGMKPEMKDS